MKNKLIIAGIAIAALLSGLLFFLNIRHYGIGHEPEPLTNSIIVSVPPSTFNLPVRIETGTLEGFLNGKIRGSFLRKNLLLQKGKKEEITLDLSKRSAISIESNGRELICTFPLTVKARLINSRFGETLARQVKPVRTDLIITLSTPITIDHNWSLGTRFRIRNIRWVNEPVVRFGPFKKNIREEITGILKSKEGKLTHMLDREIYKAANLQSTISDVWIDLQDPILISRKPAPVWIRFKCNDIHGNIALNRDAITCFTRINAKMVMLTDTTAIAKPNPLPSFKKLNSTETETLSDINLYAFTTFREINDQMNGLLRGKTLSKEGYTVTITDIHAYASSKGLSIGVSTDKDLKGHVVTSGKVLFDVPTQSLNVQNFDYFLNTENRLVSTGDNLLHEFVRDTVATKLNVRLDTLIGKVPGIVNNAIAKGKVGKVIYLKVDSLRVKKCDIMLDREKMHLLLNVHARADLRLKRIKSGKAIKIRG